MIKRPLLIGLGLATVVVVFLFLYQATQQFTFDVKGRVVGFGNDDFTVLIEHERIPDYMEAMVMPFKVRDARELDGLETGQAVGFELHVTRNRSWISEIEPLPDDSVSASPASAPIHDFVRPDHPTILTVGDPAPDLTLTDQRNRNFSLHDFKGRALLVTFIYTRCPLPDYCPRMSAHFQALQDRLASAFPDRFHLLSISFDPAYDTPEVLQQYAEHYSDNPDTWTFATGTPEQIGQAATLFGVAYEAEGIEFTHTLSTALIAPDGRIVELWRGNEWTPDMIFDSVSTLLK